MECETESNAFEQSIDIIKVAMLRSSFSTSLGTLLKDVPLKAVARNVSVDTSG